MNYKDRAETSKYNTNFYSGNEVDNFPIPLINSDTQLKISELVKKVIETKCTNNFADTSTIEKQIDEFVYQVYELSKDDIKIIEQSI